MSASLAYPVRTPQWVLTYAGVNISGDISGMVREIIYTDRLSGAAGEIEVELEDHDKLWQGPWYPQDGDLTNLNLGYANEALLPCGDFQVDDLELEFPPDIFRLRCLAAYITPAMRTINSVGFENQTLVQIASTIAAKYNLTLVTATGLENVSFARVTQSRESDLEFLHRLARNHDYDFTIRGSQMVFYARTALESQSPSLAISRADLLRGSFRSKTHRIFKAAQVSYQSPALKQLLSNTVQAAPVPAPTDTLKVIARCENGQQALLKSQSAIHGANMTQTTARLELVGDPALCAGNTVTVAGFGANDGVYLIETARHRVSRATGYVTEIEARQVPES
jgi:phage protein D